MCEEVGNRVSDFGNRILGISHCNCLERALYVKAELENVIKNACVSTPQPAAHRRRT